MISPKRVLWVKATTSVNVREIDSTTGSPMIQGNIRFVGKDEVSPGQFEILLEGQKVLYHSYYIKELREGGLLPMDKETASVSGTIFLDNMSKENK